MTRTDKWLTGLLSVAAFMIIGATAFAQSPGEALDGALAGQDEKILHNSAAIENNAGRIQHNSDGIAHNADALAERADIDRIIGEQIIDLTARLQAVEDALSETPPPVDPPVEPTNTIPLYISFDGETLTRVTGPLDIDGDFTLCALDSDGVAGPVVFTRNGFELQTEGQAAFCLFGGNDAPYPMDAVSAGDAPIIVTAPGFDDTPVVINVRAPPVDVSRTMLQVGPWFAAPYNIEEPYINIIHASETVWRGDAVISDVTGLPVSGSAESDVYFTVPAGEPRTHWDGDWVLDWATEGGCSGDVSLRFLPAEMITARGPCRIEFTRDAAGGRTPYHASIRVNRLTSPLTSLRLYRAENEQALNEGKIYNPRFVEAVSRYHVIRDMDMAEANRATIRSVDQLATLEAAHWANIEWQNRAPETKPFLGKPFAASFALGVETGAAVWFHAPMTLGSPVEIYAPEIYSEDMAQWLNNINAAVAPRRAEILASDEWERYADAFFAAADASGYPKDRPLYVTVANEVWNYAALYNYTTRYANAIGPTMRQAYGALLARLAAAMQGREYNIVFVFEGQAANAGTTAEALKGARDWLEANGHDWADFAPQFGVSVASYWGAATPSLTEAGIDPNDAAALENWFLNGPPAISNLSWIVRQWKDHERAAAAYGVPLIGAYEGGSHLERVAGFTRENHTAFVWGEAGGRINAAVNDRLAREFPGVILSNYALCGPIGGQPWFEACGSGGPYKKSWEGFMKAGGE